MAVSVSFSRTNIAYITCQVNGALSTNSYEFQTRKATVEADWFTEAKKTGTSSSWTVTSTQKDNYAYYCRVREYSYVNGSLVEAFYPSKTGEKLNPPSASEPSGDLIYIDSEYAYNKEYEFQGYASFKLDVKNGDNWLIYVSGVKKEDALEDPYFQVKLDNLYNPNAETYTVELYNKNQTGTWLYDTENVGPFSTPTTTHTLKYHANGGYNAPGNTSITVYACYDSYDLSVSYDYPLHTKYVFNGWSNSPSATEGEYWGGEELLVSGTRTIYATWKDKDYIITYNSNNNKYESFERTFNAGSSYFTPAYNTFDSYSSLKTFYKWNTNPDASGIFYSAGIATSQNIPTGDMDLYAIWNNLFTLKYDANGGDLNGITPTTVESINNSVNIPITSLEPKKQSNGVLYEFLGWSTSKSASEGKKTGTFQVSLNSAKQNTLTVYAIWRNNYVAKMPNITSTEITSITDSSFTVTATQDNLTAGSWYIQVSSKKDFSADIHTSNNGALASDSSFSWDFTGLLSNTLYYIRFYNIYSSEYKSTEANWSQKTNVSKFYWTNDDNNNIKQDQPISNITYQKWNTLQNLIRTVSIRKGSGDVAFTEVGQNDIIYAETDGMQEEGTQHQGFNNLRKRISNLGVANENLPQTVTSGADAKAEYFIKLRDAMNKAIDDVNSST